MALGEVNVKINRVMHNLWRAVDHEGEVLESVVNKTRDRKAALKFLKISLKRHGRPESIVTDRLRSYGAALKDLVPFGIRDHNACIAAHRTAHASPVTSPVYLAVWINYFWEKAGWRNHSAYWINLLQPLSVERVVVSKR